MYHGLVGGFNLTILKNISQVGDIGRMTSHILWKKKFQTTNQLGIAPTMISMEIMGLLMGNAWTVTFDDGDIMGI